MFTGFLETSQSDKTVLIDVTESWISPPNQRKPSSLSLVSSARPCSSSGKCTYSLIFSNQLSTFLQPSLAVNWQDLQLSLWFPCRVQLGPFQFKRNRCGGNAAQPLKNCCHKRQRWSGDLNLLFFFFFFFFWMAEASHSYWIGNVCDIK